ncbi:hypothetical protein [Nocardiopsis coralliicola]
MDPAEQTPHTAGAGQLPGAGSTTAGRLEARRSRAEFGARVCLTAAGAVVLLSVPAPAPFSLIGAVCGVILGTGLRIEAAVLATALERRADCPSPAQSSTAALRRGRRP